MLVYVRSRVRSFAIRNKSVPLLKRPSCSYWKVISGQAFAYFLMASLTSSRSKALIAATSSVQASLGDTLGTSLWLMALACLHFARVWPGRRVRIELVLESSSGGDLAYPR